MLSLKLLAALCMLALVTSLILRSKTQEGYRELETVTRLSKEVDKGMEDVHVELKMLSEQLKEARDESRALQGRVQAKKNLLDRERDLDCNKEAFLESAKLDLGEEKEKAEVASSSDLADANERIKSKIQFLEETETKTRESIHKLESKKQELASALTQAEGSVALGRALKDNNPVLAERFVQRVLGSSKGKAPQQSYLASYVYNQRSAAQEKEKILLPKWQGMMLPIGTMTKELRQVLPKQDPFLHPKKVMYGTCAVVGNSGTLLFHPFGPDIDAHDAVLRLNAGVTRGFEDFVGNRTSIRFVNRLHFGFQEKIGEEVVMQQVTNEQTLKQFVESKTQSPEAFKRVFMVSTDFHSHVQRDLAKPATNGLYAIFFALQRCEKVKVFGFYRKGGGGQGSENSFVTPPPYHYFDSQKPLPAQRSRDLQEWPLITELARRSGGRLEIATVSPPLTPSMSD